MKETKILKNNKESRALKVHAQSSKQAEQILENLTNNSLETISEALADKDKTIEELKEKLNKQTKLIIEGKEFKIYKYFRHWYVDKLSLIIFFDKERDK
jgi:ribosomal protein S13